MKVFTVKAIIHGLSVENAVPIDVDPADYLVVKNGYCKPIVFGTNETFHAVRYGNVVNDRNNPGRLILTTPLKNKMK